MAFRKGRPIYGYGDYRGRMDPVDWPNGKYYGQKGCSYSYGTVVAEVEVDPETGRVDILNMWTAHDGGRELNPMLVRGQIVGSAVMHLGQALFEGIIRDDKGKTLNPSFLDYKMATFMDIPRDHKLYSMDIPDTEGPFGAKEAGEGAGLPVLASIANAISDAVGVRFASLPITPEKIVMAIKGKEK